jgi:hypothetical protein
VSRLAGSGIVKGSWQLPIFCAVVQGEIVLMRLIIDSHPSIVTFTLQLFHYLIPAFLPIYYTVFEIVQFLKSIPIENLSSNCTAVS